MIVNTSELIYRFIFRYFGNFTSVLLVWCYSESQFIISLFFKKKHIHHLSVIFKSFLSVLNKAEYYTIKNRWNWKTPTISEFYIVQPVFLRQYSKPIEVQLLLSCRLTDTVAFPARDASSLTGACIPLIVFAVLADACFVDPITKWGQFNTNPFVVANSYWKQNEFLPLALLITLLPFIYSYNIPDSIVNHCTWIHRTHGKNMWTV